MKSGIYKITNTENGKFYIGSSNDIEYRWLCHKRNLKNKTHINPKLQHAWDFYGEDKFIFEIVEETDQTKEILLEKENYYFSLLKQYESKIGYNICPKAEGGDNITYNPNRDEFIEKMLVINKGEGNGMFGKNHSYEAIQKQKEMSVGRYTLDWFIEKYGQEEGNKKFQDRNTMLKNRKMNYFQDNKCLGVKRGPMSNEVKKLISERKAHLKLIRNDLHKDILSDSFTLMQLQLKYGTSKPTILREKRKLNSQ